MSRLASRSWGRDPGHDLPPGTPPRGLVLALVLACASLMVLDIGTDDVVEPARAGIGEMISPAQVGAAALTRPIAQLPESFRTRSSLRRQVAELQAENSQLKGEVRKAGYNRNRLAEYEGLTTAARDHGFALVPSRVIGVGEGQSFSDTVVIDAGSDAGVTPDMTVLNNDGLVGRVLRTTRTTSTVLLIVDADSTVGGRIGTSMDLGFLRGRGDLGGGARLDLELLDQAVIPNKGDTVVTWGSEGAGPYVPGVPIGQVVSAYSSVRETSQRVVLDPYVDFSQLDLVGVVVPSGVASDRGVIEADGSVR